jgi:hypothetical protein
METQVSRTELEVSDAGGKRAKINALLLEILPGSTTLAEMEMIGDNVFGMVESWWKHGSVTKRQIPVPKGLPREPQ